MKKDNFVLPEAWYVVVDDKNIDVLTKWRYDGEPSHRGDLSNKIVGWCKSAFNGVVYSKEHNPVISVTGKEYDFGQEITFEQFKKYVLNENIVEVEEDLTYLKKLFKKLKIK